MPEPIPEYFLDWKYSNTVLNGCLVFFMQVGFVAIETGFGRAKNVQNILLKNMVNAMLCALCWWAYGYAFAYGGGNGIIGYEYFFFGSQDPVRSVNGETMRPWFFTLTYVLVANTIVSGCLAERAHLLAYPSYTVLISSIIHPLAAHWVWSPISWLKDVSECQLLDFAGGLVVHSVGGLVGLLGAWRCGPRLGRFDPHGESLEIPGHDMVYVTLGTFMLWFGFYGFNIGTTYIYRPHDFQFPRVAVCTTVAASASGLSSLLACFYITGRYDIKACCNGLLAGLVVSTSVAAFVDSWAAFILGGCAGMLYLVSSRLLVKMGIDDPLDSSAVHLGSGLLSVLGAGLLAKPQHTQQLGASNCGGLFYGVQGGKQLGMQLLGVVVILTLTGMLASVLFWLLSRSQLLRVDQTTELAGIDNMEHGGPAYPEFNLVRLQQNNGSHASMRP